MALERVALGSSRCRAPRWGPRAGDHRGGRSPRPRLRAGGDTPSVRGPQPDGAGTSTATAERRGAGDSPGRGGSRGRSARGAPGTAKLSPPPEVRGAEAASPAAPSPAEPQEKAPPRAARPAALTRTPGPARPALTWLYSSLTDMTPAGRAEPGPRGQRAALARVLGAAGPGSSRPRRLSVHGRPVWRHLPGLPESFSVLFSLPRPAPPASWRRRGRLALGRRDLYSRGGGGGAAAAGQEWRAGERPRGAAPRSGMGGGAGGRGRARVLPAGAPPPPPLSPAGAGPAAPPAPRAAAGSSRPGAGPREEQAPSAPCWTPGALGTGARRVPTPAARRPLSAQTALWEAGRGPIGDQKKRGGSTREGRRGIKRRDACGRKAPYTFLWVLRGH